MALDSAVTLQENGVLGLPVLIFPNEERVFSLVSRSFSQRGGFNTEVLFIRYEEDGRRKVEKRIGAKREGFSLEEAGEILKDLVYYQHLLCALGVPMPAIDADGFSIRYDPTRNKALVYAISDWTGFDIEYLMNVVRGRSVKRKHTDFFAPIVQQMVCILKRVCADRISPTETRVGIDPKPSNFTIDEKGEMWYVDPFPPRYRKLWQNEGTDSRGEPIIEWHPLRTTLGRELGYFKYYDVRGIFLGLTAQLARICPREKVFFENICLEFFEGALTPSVWQEFVQELSRAPWRILRQTLQVSPEKDSRILQRCRHIIQKCFQKKLFGVDYHVYTLREFALELAYAGYMTEEEMEEFFYASHFEEELPPERLHALQEMLCTFLTADRFLRRTSRDSA